MIRGLRRILHPAWYQGKGSQPPYFEGWYFKLVDPTERHRIAVIPGILKGVDPTASHAFVQILDGRCGEASYHAYSTEAFHSSEESFDIHIGDSRFSLERLTLGINGNGRSLTGQVDFVELKPWPVSVTSPGVMGWFAWIPLLQTYHGVLSLDHVICGSLALNGEEIDFAGGRGYIEKDWGRSFPDAWIWTQTNHFDQVGTSLTVSIATIPFLGTSFRGFTIGLRHLDRLYRFATYTGARIQELSADERAAHVVVADGRHRLELVAHSANTGMLRGPTGQDMTGRVPESLDGEIGVRLSATAAGGGSKLIYAGRGRNAGVEMVGDLEQLLA